MSLYPCRKIRLVRFSTKAYTYLQLHSAREASFRRMPLHRRSTPLDSVISMSASPTKREEMKVKTILRTSSSVLWKDARRGTEPHTKLNSCIHICRRPRRNHRPLSDARHTQKGVRGKQVLCDLIHIIHVMQILSPPFSKVQTALF